MRAKQTVNEETKKRKIELVQADYQPSRSELREEVEPPADLAELPFMERLAEGARRLLQPVEIRYVNRPRR